ncbi:UDP-N-acetylglucosamine--N-acetylmuramyl-(pentapeptide) pyrophosphoryl-undecaprenol N-acetylglucosamine transferase [Methanosarcina sp. UBA5]|uniref:UDP-N-acetylglucosamine--N-acetylmuramyl- (pentapeptide) pyrophosphoryl-undecaprenol N-acetylglucosamine transferase n=1 Tax=Methanosarcina sp. UBA5 TaxID=1915593 RepID=UPI0025E851B9|nr:glycosyltransferase [Methanosarcina sp. UBA5]
MKVLIFICGEGLGHTSRCTALGQELLAAGHEVYLGAYGYSKEFIERKGYKTVEIPPEIKLVGDSGSLDLKKSVISTLKSGSVFGIFKVLSLLKEKKPDIVVTDSYFTGVVASKIRVIPVYLMVNQSNMETFFKNGGVVLRTMGGIIKQFYTCIFRIVNRIIIPDFPMPYTVCRLNLVFEEKVSKNLFFSGPLTLEKFDDVKAEVLQKPHVLSLIGGFGYREPIFRKVIEVAKLDRNINYTLLSGPNLNPDVFSNLPENVTIKRFINDQFPYLKASDLVIAPGGHSTIMEALTFGVPMLSFPDINHSEQESNAAIVDLEGYGRRMDYNASPEEILQAIRELLKDKKIHQKVEDMKKLSKDLNATAAIKKLLESNNTRN